MLAAIRSKALWLFIAALPLAASTCREKEPADPTVSGNLTLEVSHYFDGAGYFRKNYTYELDSANTVLIERFRYFISGLKLLDANGSVLFADTAQMYHLVSPNDEGIYTTTFPYSIRGAVSAVEVSLGIDSLANHNNQIRKGDLRGANGMDWGWVMGYKFLLMEGTAATGPDSSGGLLWHIGFDENHRTLRFNLPAPVAGSKDLKIALNATLKNLFVGRHSLLPIHPNREVMFDTAAARNVADNYSTGFLTLESVR